jgi:hypothetical protein
MRATSTESTATREQCAEMREALALVWSSYASLPTWESTSSIASVPSRVIT